MKTYEDEDNEDYNEDSSDMRTNTDDKYMDDIDGDEHNEGSGEIEDAVY